MLNWRLEIFLRVIFSLIAWWLFSLLFSFALAVFINLLLNPLFHPFPVFFAGFAVIIIIHKDQYLDQINSNSIKYSKFVNVNSMQYL